MLGTLITAGTVIGMCTAAFNGVCQSCRELGIGLGDDTPIAKESPMVESIKQKLLPKKEEEE